MAIKPEAPGAKIFPIRDSTQPRKPGGWEGKVWIADDFEDPLPEYLLAAFEDRTPSAVKKP